MATWKRLGGDPLTTEREIRVYDVDTGVEGDVGVSWELARGRPSLYGPVTRVTERFFNPDGSEYAPPRREVLDLNPTFA